MGNPKGAGGRVCLGQAALPVAASAESTTVPAACVLQVWVMPGAPGSGSACALDPRAGMEAHSGLILMNLGGLWRVVRESVCPMFPLHLPSSVPSTGIGGPLLRPPRRELSGENHGPRAGVREKVWTGDLGVQPCGWLTSLHQAGLVERMTSPAWKSPWRVLGSGVGEGSPGPDREELGG